MGADEEGIEHGIDKAALNPLSERTFEVVDALLGELAALFPDECASLAFRKRLSPGDFSRHLKNGGSR